MEVIPSFRQLSDAELTKTVDSLARDERHSTVDLIAGLEEFDRRRLYLPLGCSSLFSYCTKHLHLSEGAAYDRIEAARAARRFPVLLERLAQGAITLSTVSLVGRHLTAANHVDLIEECRHKSKRDVEVIVARLAPRPDAATMIRRVARSPRPAATERSSEMTNPAATATLVNATPDATRQEPVSPAVPRPVIAPLSPERFRLQVTISGEAHEDLRQLQNLMRHAIPSGDAAHIVERALKVLLKDVLRKKCGIVNRPRRGDALQKLIEVH